MSMAQPGAVRARGMAMSGDADETRSEELQRVLAEHLRHRLEFARSDLRRALARAEYAERLSVALWDAYFERRPSSALPAGSGQAVAEFRQIWRDR
jgi:hypothetical protein